MKQLIEDYERRLQTAETMLKEKNYSSITQAERIKTKASCYRTFLAELKQQCNIANVSKRFDFDKLLQDYRQAFVNGGGYVKSDTFESSIEPYEVFEWFKKKLS